MIRQPFQPRHSMAMSLPRPGAQSGFTLLEILVAIVVLSIGLLGLAGLQVVSLNNNQTAYYRSIATQQAWTTAWARSVRTMPSASSSGRGRTRRRRILWWSTITCCSPMSP